MWASFPSNIQDPESTKKFSVGYGGTDDPVGQWSAQASSEGGWHWHEDPRLKVLGFRGIFPRESIRMFNFSHENGVVKHFLS